MNEKLDELLAYITDKWALNPDFSMSLYLDIVRKIKELKEKKDESI